MVVVVSGLLRRARCVRRMPLCAECGRPGVCFVSRPEDARYRLGVDRVLDDAREVEAVAAELSLCPRLLGVWVGHRRTNLEFLAEIEAEERLSDG